MVVHRVRTYSKQVTFQSCLLLLYPKCNIAIFRITIYSLQYERESVSFLICLRYSSKDQKAADLFDILENSSSTVQPWRS